jgi:hypothetical protein
MVSRELMNVVPVFVADDMAGISGIPITDICYKRYPRLN